VSRGRKKPAWRPALDAAWIGLAEALPAGVGNRQPDAAATLARQWVETLLFARLCIRAGRLDADWPRQFAGLGGKPVSLGTIRQTLEDRLGAGLFRTRPEAEIPELPATADEPAGRLPSAGLVRCWDRLAKAAETSPQPPVDWLGEVHQYLLWRTLTRSGGGGWKAAAASARRRAGGVYYTPGYVAEYIARRCLAGRGEPARGDCRPENDRPGRPAVLDPACGCGRFLLSGCRQLLQRFGHLGDAQRRHRVAGLLHGVDVDCEAVLVARRGLWLELAGPLESAAQRAALLGELTRNVVCGDALTGPELAGRESTFDVVLGNPPYRRERYARELLERVGRTEFGRRYRAARMDLWYYFVHRGVELLRPGGRLAFIVSAYWTSSRGASKLIETLRREVRIEEIFSLGSRPIFPHVAGRHMILSLVKDRSDRPTTIKTAAGDSTRPAEPLLTGKAPLVIFHKGREELFRQGRIDLEPPAGEWLEKLARLPRLGSLGRIRQGIAENPATVTRRAAGRHGNRWDVGEGVFSLGPDEVEQLALDEREQRLLRPYHDPCDLGRYHLAAVPSRVLIYSTARTWPEEADYPRLGRHLGRFRPLMEARRETRRGTRRWWQLHWPREAGLWRSPKLVALQMARRPSFAVARQPVYVSFSVNVFLPHADRPEDLAYFAAVLNSRLLWKWFRHCGKRRGVGLEINGHVLAEAPIVPMDFARPADRTRHDRLVQLADRMRRLTSQVKQATGQPARKRLLAELDRTEQQIDALIYRLYGLSEEEIDGVETAVRSGG